MVQSFVHNLDGLLSSAVILCAAVLIALLAHFVIFRLLRRYALRTRSVLGQSLLKYGRGPTRWIFPLLAVLAVLPSLSFPPIVMLALGHITGIGLIAAIAWLVILFIDVLSDIIAGRYRVDVADNLIARRVHTQFEMLRRILMVVVGIVTLSIMLMTFPEIRQIGVSLLARRGWPRW